MRENLQHALGIIEAALVVIGNLAGNPKAKAEKTIEHLNRMLGGASRALRQERSSEIGIVMDLIRTASDELGKQGAPGASKAHASLTEAARSLKRLSSMW